MTAPLAAVPVLEFRRVSRVYPGPPPVTALRSVDLAIGRGEFVTVAGPSGSGKSTLLNLAGLLDAPTGGRYLLDGLDTGGLTDAERASLRGRRIGFVFQEFHLLPHRSAVDNVMLAQLYTLRGRRERRRRAVALLAMVGLAHRSGTPVSKMSGGERQRVAIARALANDPSFLICDEPTGSLDTATASSVLEGIAGMHRGGLTVIMATHDVGIAASGQRCLVVRDGMVSEAGSGDLSAAVTQSANPARDSGAPRGRAGQVR